jgi:ABC-type phosphate transport system substrate-binding protein
MKKLVRFTLILVLFGIGVLSNAAEGFQVIVNVANPTSSLPKDQLSRIFLKKTQKWDNGQAIIPVDQDQASAARSAFSKAVHGRPASAVASYWQQQIFAGKDVPPAEKANDAAVIAFVKANTGAVGYVSITPPADVKVLSVE